MSKILTNKIHAAIEETLIRHVDEHTAFTLAKDLSEKIVKDVAQHTFTEIKTKTVYRDAVTGKFVSKQYVEDNPNTTFKSKIKNFFGM